LAGTALREILGLEITGNDFLSFLKKDGDAFSWLFNQQFYMNPNCWRQSIRIKYASGSVTNMDMTILPLVGNNDENHLFLLLEFENPKIAMLEETMVVEAGMVIRECSIDIPTT
jgi:hypothetical protein